MRADRQFTRSFATCAIAVLVLALAPGSSPASAQNDRDTEACFKARDPDTRIAACTRAIDRAQQAGNKRTVALAHAARASGHESKKDLDRAIADYDIAIRLMGEVAPASWELAFHYWTRGHVFRAKGDVDRAIADYGDSIRVAPKWDKAYSDRSAIYYQKSDYPRALADIDQVIGFRPDNPRVAYAYAARAMIHSKMGKPDIGLADADRAVRMAPKDAFNYFTRAQLYEALARKNEAIADYRKALELRPSARNEVEDALKRLGVQP